MKPKVYIAGPYSNGDHLENTKQAIAVAEKLIKLGYVPFVPHLNHWWDFLFPHQPQYWYDYDNEWLPLCQYIVRIPGKSKGADDEMELAKKLNIKEIKL